MFDFLTKHLLIIMMIIIIIIIIKEFKNMALNIFFYYGIKNFGFVLVFCTEQHISGIVTLIPTITPKVKVYVKKIQIPLWISHVTFVTASCVCGETVCVSMPHKCRHYVFVPASIFLPGIIAGGGRP